MKNYQIEIIEIKKQTSFFQAPLGYRRFRIGCVFAEYDLFKT